MDLDRVTELIRIVRGSDDPEQSRWHARITAELARSLVVLSTQLVELDDAAQKIYPDALHEALLLMPEGHRVEVLPDTHHLLGSIATQDPELRALIHQHISCFNPRHESCCQERRNGAFIEAATL
jgi:hypothetical protein